MASKAHSRQGRRIVTQGRRYWSDRPTSRGRSAGIGWAPRSGSWTRCVRRVSRFLGPRARGYCTNRMHEAIGIYPGSRANTGKSGRSKRS